MRRKAAREWDAARGIVTLSARRLRAHWGLTILLFTGTFLAVGLAAAAPIYLQSIRDLGLSSLLREAEPGSLDLHYAITVPAVASNVGETEDLIETEVQAAAGAVIGTRSVTQQSPGYVVQGLPSSLDEEGSLGEERDLRALFRWHTSFMDLTRLDQGERQTWDGTGPVPAEISQETARRFGLQVGDRITLLPFWLSDPAPTEVVVRGIFTPLRDDPRWIDPDSLLEIREDFGIPLWISREAFFILGAVTPQMRGALQVVYFTDATSLHGDEASALGSALARLEIRLAQRVPNLNQISDLPALLSTFDARFTFAQSSLLVIVLQLVAVLLLYLVITAAMVAEQRTEEVAWLRSRGASIKRVAGLQLVESLMITALPVALGPLIALGLVSLLGFVPPFDELDQGRFVAARLTPLAWYLALIAGGLAVLAQFVPTIRASRRTIVNVRQSQSRLATDWRARVMVDSLMLTLAAVLVFELRRDSSSAVSLGGDASLELLSVATPAILLFAVGLVVLRLFPIVLRLVFRATASVMPPAPLLSMVYLGRSPTHYGRILLLMLVVSAIAVFASSFKATLDRSYDERALYATGSDLRLDGLAARQVDAPAARATLDQGAWLPGLPAPIIATIDRFDGRLSGDERANTASVLAADTAALQKVAFLRSDFGPAIRSNLGLLSVPPPPSGPKIGAPVGSVGLWVRFEESGPGTSLFVRVRDEVGNYFEYSLGFLVEADRVGGEQFVPVGDAVPVRLISTDGTTIAEGAEIDNWFFLERSLATPSTVIDIGGRRPFGSALNAPPPRGELEIISISLLRFGGRADVHGRVFMDDLTWTTASETRVLDDFSDPRAWEVIPPSPLQAPRERAGLVDSPSVSGPSALELEWEAASLNFDAGIRRRSGGEPLPALVSADLIERGGAAVGQTLLITTGSVDLEVKVVGRIDHFPTFDSTDSRGLVILDSAAFTRTVLTSPNAGSRIRSEPEFWIAAPGSPDSAILDLLGVDPEAVGIHSASLERAQIEADPLVVAGWNGIFAASLFAIAVAASFGLTALTVLMARTRRVQFSVLRSVGFGPLQVVLIVVLEIAVVVSAGLGLGLLLATQAGPILLDLFALTPDGRDVLPPLIFELDWRTLGWVFAALLGLFVGNAAAAVVFVWRLELQSALRTSA